MRRIQILFSQRATREIEAARTWWRSHASTLDAIDDELAATLRLLEGVPEMGPRVQVRSRGSTVRRVRLEMTGYHLYYRVELQAERLIVLCFWHERRRPPRL